MCRYRVTSGWRLPRQLLYSRNHKNISHYVHHTHTHHPPPPQDPNRRSQLWRMTSSRQLVHISSSSSSSEREMVLGVAGRLPPPGQFTPLLVERRRESREDRQTWRFTAVRGSCVWVCACACACVGVCECLLFWWCEVCLCVCLFVSRMGGCYWIRPNTSVSRAQRSTCHSEKVLYTIPCALTYSTYSNSHTLMYVCTYI